MADIDYNKYAMKLKSLRIIAVGRLKTPFWKAAAEHYTQRIQRWIACMETIIRDGDPALPIVDRNSCESKGILAAITPLDIPIGLDEHGNQFSSRQFSVFLDQLLENTSRRPCFIIGGAFGFDPAVQRIAAHTLALGKLTLPHELARVVLLEQIYRAELLLHHIPYHHA